MKKATLQRLQHGVASIPAMPEIWHEIQHILQQEGASARDVGSCVVRDPVLTAHVLKLCNSAAFTGRAGKVVTDIPLAIARMGMAEATNVIFRSLAPDMGRSQTARNQVRLVWHHAQMISRLSGMIAEAAQQADAHEAALHGMLHDIGKLVMLHIEDVADMGALRMKLEGGADTLQAEDETFGYTHIDAGMMLALHWRLPDRVRRVLAMHHHPTGDALSLIPPDLQRAELIQHLAHLACERLLPTSAPDAQPGVWSGAGLASAEGCEGMVGKLLSLPMQEASLVTLLQHEVLRAQKSLAAQA